LKILVTNDDGIQAPGIRTLAKVLINLGHSVTVVAPTEEYSGASRSRIPRPKAGTYNLTKDLNWMQGVDVFTLNGSPAACVVAGLTFLFSDPQKVDLCISGINAGANLGQGLTISGTFGAALEAISYGVPSISISRGVGGGLPESWNWENTAIVLNMLLTTNLKTTPPRSGEIFNINIPDDASQFTEARWTIVSRQSYFFDTYNDDDGIIQSRIIYDPSLLSKSDDISVFAEEGLISITALTTNSEGLLSIAFRS
jgi:5'/3'-nucleotidase SurE